MAFAAAMAGEIFVYLWEHFWNISKMVIILTVIAIVIYNG